MQADAKKRLSVMAKRRCEPLRVCLKAWLRRCRCGPKWGGIFDDCIEVGVSDKTQAQFPSTASMDCEFKSQGKICVEPVVFSFEVYATLTRGGKDWKVSYGKQYSRGSSCE